VTPPSPPAYAAGEVRFDLRFAHQRAAAERQPGIERVQALADISRSALCCHRNETRALIANPPNSAQLEGTPTIPPAYIRVRAVVWVGLCGEGQPHRQT